MDNKSSNECGVLEQFRADRERQLWAHGGEGYECHCHICDGIREIERLTDSITRHMAIAAGLATENTQLRGALQWYAKAVVPTMHPEFPGSCDDGRIARRALMGLPDETRACNGNCQPLLPDAACPVHGLAATLRAENGEATR